MFFFSLSLGFFYTEDLSSWDGAFGKIDHFKFAVPSDHPVSLTAEDLSLARGHLIKAEQSDLSERQTLASVLVVLTSSERVALDDARGVEYVWPSVSGPNWAVGLPKQLSILADGFIHLVDKALLW